MIDDAFIRRSLAKRNHAHNVWVRLAPDRDDPDAFDGSQSHEARFTIIEPVVGAREAHALEDGMSLFKSQIVLVDVDLVLRLIPLESHRFALLHR